MKFYLGTDRTGWIGNVTVPLFMSHRVLRIRRKLRPMVCDWALDSGGFTEITMHGRWITPAEEYVEAVHRYVAEMGRMDWAAPQDWMCEPHMLAKTGKTIAEHQQLTTENVLRLRELAPELPFVPVLQGWEVDDYLAHVALYAEAGIDVTAEPTVGIGSVCRRQATSEIGEIVGELHALGIRCHGFGVKSAGLRKYAHYLASSDSMAWSFNARWVDPLPGCPHRKCNHCLRYALLWRERILRSAGVDDPYPLEAAA